MNYSKFYGADADFENSERRIENLERIFENNEGKKCEYVFSSPGRAEILGNHTDHNHGKVIVAAISCDILACVSKENGNVIKVCSEGFPNIVVDLSDLSEIDSEKGTSTALVKGVARAISDKNLPIGGFTAYLTSNVFKGAGVSSSAAFEVLIAEIFNELYLGGALTPFEKAVISQYAENVYFGKPCGLLDQSGIAIGSLVGLDFADPLSPSIKHLGEISGYSLVITNTGGDHSMLTPHYAAIREEMEQIANYFGKKVLREVPYDTFYEHIAALMQNFSGRAILRAIHFYEENERVDIASNAILSGDVETFLKQVNASGLSSISKLQNSYPAGDTAQPLLLGIELSHKIIKHGAVRLHGGGFAGSMLAIVRNDETEEYIAKMKEYFGEQNVFKASVRPLGTARVK